jgi:hypothetical protein
MLICLLFVCLLAERNDLVSQEQDFSQSSAKLEEFGASR